MLYLLVLIAIFIAVWAEWIMPVVSEIGTTGLLFKWFLGHSILSDERTDAGWFRPGRKILHPSGKASRWHHRPRLVRAGIRTSMTAAFLASLWGLRYYRELTFIILIVVASLLVLLTGVLIYFRVVNWKHHRTYSEPLHVTLGTALGNGEVSHKSWLTVPRNFHAGKDILIRLPHTFPGDTRARSVITDIVSQKLGIAKDELVSDFYMLGRPNVKFRVLPAPPDHVSLNDVRKLIESTADSRPLIGLGRGKAPVYADLDNDSPHILISAGTGGGKSVTLRSLVAQLMRLGAIVLILDIKRQSHMWARGLEAVRYCRNIEEIHNALLWLQTEIDRRNRLADQDSAKPGSVNVGPRIVVVAEEMNATTNRLSAYWKTIRKSSDSNTSPAVQALGDALFMGREVKVNVFAVAQMFTARTAGGPEARENMGTRILSRYTANNWKMLVPEVWPMPRTKRKAGRVQVYLDGSAHETQVLFLSLDEARKLASSGIVSNFDTGLTYAGDNASPPSEQSNSLVSVVSEPRIVSLKYAVDNGLVSMKLAALRTARARDPEFPKPISKSGTGTTATSLYDVEALKRWESNRA